DHFSALCPTIVLDDANEALQIGARGQRFFAESLAHWYAGGPPPDPGDPDEDQVARITDAKEQLFTRMHEMKIPISPNAGSTFNVEHAYGTWRDAIAYVERLEAA